MTRSPHPRPRRTRTSARRNVGPSAPTERRTPAPWYSKSDLAAHPSPPDGATPLVAQLADDGRSNMMARRLDTSLRPGGPFMPNPLRPPLLAPAPIWNDLANSLRPVGNEQSSPTTDTTDAGPLVPESSRRGGRLFANGGSVRPGINVASPINLAPPNLAANRLRSTDALPSGLASSPAALRRADAERFPARHVVSNAMPFRIMTEAEHGNTSGLHPRPLDAVQAANEKLSPAAARRSRATGRLVRRRQSARNDALANDNEPRMTGLRAADRLVWRRAHEPTEDSAADRWRGSANQRQQLYATRTRQLAQGPKPSLSNLEEDGLAGLARLNAASTSGRRRTLNLADMDQRRAARRDGPPARARVESARGMLNAAAPRSAPLVGIASPENFVAEMQKAVLNGDQQRKAEQRWIALTRDQQHGNEMLEKLIKESGGGARF